MATLVAAICYRRKCSSVISDGERRANFHGALYSVGFLGRFGLFKEMNNSFVAILRYEIRSFFETDPTQSATGIHE